MIILDTNVLSELIKAEPDKNVADWFRFLPQDEVFTTTISQAEVLYGLARMPHGRRRANLDLLLTRLFSRRFAGRILPFDQAAAAVFGDIVVRRLSDGRGFDYADAQIAAIALSLGATVATRNVSDFESCGVKIVDPWTAQTRPSP